MSMLVTADALRLAALLLLMMATAVEAKPGLGNVMGPGLFAMASLVVPGVNAMPPPVLEMPPECVACVEEAPLRAYGDES